MPSTTNLEEEEIVDAPGNDGDASMPEQVNRPNPWREMMMMMMITMMTRILNVSKLNAISCAHTSFNKTVVVHITLTSFYISVYLFIYFYLVFFLVIRHFRKVAKRDTVISFVISVRLPVHTEQLCCRWTDFYEI